MQKVSNVFVLVVVLNLATSLVLAQDTVQILRFPPVNLVDEIVNAKVTQRGNLFRYEYRLVSLTTSKQDIWAFDIPIETEVRNLGSPEGWIALTGRGVHRIGWGGDSAYFLRPGNNLVGFRFESSGLPVIITYYVEGWIEPLILDFDPDSVAGGDVLEDSKQGRTIGAASLPSRPIPLSFLDTLLSYTRQSAELGWLAPLTGLGKERDDDYDDDERPDEGITKNIEQRLQKAKRELTKRDSVQARKELEKLVQKVERIWKRSEAEEKKQRRDRWEKRDKVIITSEAYALLKYNTEYLIERLPERTRRGRGDEEKHKKPEKH